jgi:hypothetical protein
MGTLSCAGSFAGLDKKFDKKYPNGFTREDVVYQAEASGDDVRLLLQ